jgi:hypothetical protein
MVFLCPSCNEPLLETFEEEEKKIKFFYVCLSCRKKYSFRLLLYDDGEEMEGYKISIADQRIN